MKKLLTLMLAVLLVFGCCSVASAAVLDDAAATMKELNVFTGDPNGDMRLDDPLARREFFKISAMLGGHQPVAYRSAFTDIAAGDWYAGYAQALADAGMLLGYEGGTALPHNNITQRELGVMLLRLQGKAPQWANADSEIIAAGLAANINYNGNAAVTRAEAILMCANLKTEFTGIVSSVENGVAAVLTEQGVVTVAGLKAKLGDVVEGITYGVIADAEKLNGSKAEGKIWKLNMPGTTILIDEEEYRIAADAVFFGLIEKEGATRAAIIDNGTLRLFDNLKGDSISIVKADGDLLQAAVIKNPVFNIEDATWGIVDEIYQSKGEYYITFIGCDMEFYADEEDAGWDSVDDFDAVVFFAEDGQLTYVDTLFSALMSTGGGDDAAFEKLTHYATDWKMFGSWQAITDLNRDLGYFRIDGYGVWYDENTLIYTVDTEAEEISLGDSGDIKKDREYMLIADEERDVQVMLIKVK